MTERGSEMIKDNLTFKKLFLYFGIHEIYLKQDTFEQELGFLTPDGQYNLLAHLLSDDADVSVRAAVIIGKTKADPVYCVRDFGHQCLLFSLEQVLMFGDAINVMQGELMEKPVRRRERKLFDNEAWKAAVINAFVHNDWSSGLEPMITVYSNRIEILSHGALPEEQSRQGMFSGEPVPVNRGLAEIFRMLHISEGIGSGVRKVTDAYGEKAYTFGDHSVTVTIPFHWLNLTQIAPSAGGYQAVHGTTACDPGKEDRRPAASLPPLQRRILSALRRNPHLTKAKLAEKLKVGKTTVDKSIAVLKNNGLIERVGSNKTGYWNVIS